MSAEATRSKSAMLLELEALLKQRHADDETTVLIIDEAQSLPLDLLEEIRLLANIETDELKLLSVIIAGQPELADRLNEQALRQLKQRIALRCELRQLTLPETAGYIAGRIRAAGGVGAQVFTREAVALIHKRSQGIPRTISVIADNALLGGFAAGQRPVASQLVEDVCRDFDLHESAMPIAPAALPPAPPVVPDAAIAAAAPPRLIVPASTGREPGSEKAAGMDPAADGPPIAEVAAAKRKRFSFFWN